MSGILHCRLPPALLEKLDDQVEQLRAEGVDPDLASRSGVVRTLLARALGEGTDEVVSREVTSQVYRKLQLIAREVMARVQAELPSIAHASRGTSGGNGRGVSGARRKRR